MKISHIKIRNLLGITELELTGKSTELTGAKGTGKTSVLDAIRFALTNRLDRDLIIHQGATEGEILIETDTGLVIDRKKRDDKADAIKVKDGSMLQTRPAEYLAQIFTPLQLNPIEFTQMTRQEKNRVILNLIEFAWSIDWIREKFGEVPAGVNYNQHILQVLADIQAENGIYFQSRQDVNRDIRNKRAFIEDIAKSIPEGYQYDRWNQYDLGGKYAELEKKRRQNNLIEKARMAVAGYDNRLRGINADREIATAAAEKAIQSEREGLKSTIERLRAEIRAAEDKLAGLDSKLQDKVKVITAQFEAAKAQLDRDNAANLEWVDRQLEPIDDLMTEVVEAEVMKKHLNEYQRMMSMTAEVGKMQERADELTTKIELARELPGEILKTAKIPIDGLTVENGVPLIHGLPISNLSDGELLALSVDITIQKPGGLQIILIDGVERLDTKSREELYAKCKEKGVQIIASRTTDSETLQVVEL